MSSGARPAYDSRPPPRTLAPVFLAFCGHGSRLCIILCYKARRLYINAGRCVNTAHPGGWVFRR